MPKYKKCPTCGNSEKGYRVVKCTKCGDVGCYKENIFIPIIRSGCVNIDRCSKCDNYGFAILGGLFGGAYRPLGKIV